MNEGTFDEGNCRKLIMKLLLAYLFIFSYSHVFLLLPPYLERTGFDPHVAGWIVSAFYMATTVVRPTAGLFVERFGIRRTLLGASSICLAGALLLAFLPSSAVHLFLVRLLMGAGFSVFVVTLTTCQGLMIPAEMRGTSFAITSIGGVATAFTVVPLADLFVRRGQYSLYLAMPIVGALLCMAIAAFLGTSSRRGTARTPSWGSYRELLADGSFPALLISCVFFGLMDSSIVYASSLALSRGLTPSFFITPVAVGAIIIRLFGRGLYSRLPRTSIAAPSFGVMAVALFGGSFASENAVLVLWGLLFGCAVGYAYPTHLALIGDLVPEELRPKASSLVYFAMDLSWASLPLYMGYVSSAIGLSIAFRFFAAFTFLSSLAVYFLVWRRVERRMMEV